MGTFKNLYSSIRRSEEIINRERQTWKCPGLKADDFLKLLKHFGSLHVNEKCADTDFIIDKNNQDTIQQLYFYLIGDKKNCRLELYRGIYMMGTFGCGKTLLLKSFLDVQDYVTRHITTMVHSKMLSDIIYSRGVIDLSTKPLFIDDVGRENIEDIDFGKKIKPFTDLIALRYEKGALTFATSNFMIESLAGDVKNRGYGTYITSRMEEMFNVIKLPGANRRKKSEYEAK